MAGTPGGGTAGGSLSSKTAPKSDGGTEGPWFKVPQSFVREHMGKIKTLGELKAVLALMAHANADGICWPSLTRMAGFAEMSRSQMSRGINEAVKRGIVRRLERGCGPRKSTRYQVVLDSDPDATVANQIVTPMQHNGDSHATEIVTRMQPDSDPDAPLTELRTEPKEQNQQQQAAAEFFVRLKSEGIEEGLARELSKADATTIDTAFRNADVLSEQKRLKSSRAAYIIAAIRGNYVPIGNAEDSDDFGFGSGEGMNEEDVKDLMTKMRVEDNKAELSFLRIRPPVLDELARHPAMNTFSIRLAAIEAEKQPADKRVGFTINKLRELETFNPLIPTKTACDLINRGHIKHVRGNTIGKATWNGGGLFLYHRNGQLIECIAAKDLQFHLFEFNPADQLQPLARAAEGEQPPSASPSPFWKSGGQSSVAQESRNVTMSL